MIGVEVGVWLPTVVVEAGELEVPLEVLLAELAVSVAVVDEDSEDGGLGFWMPN